MHDIKITSHGQTQGTGEHRKDQALRKACKEFESIFTYEMLKSMRRTIDKTGLLHGGPGEEIFESLLDQEMAKKISGGSPNSLAGMLYSQLQSQDPLETGNQQNESGFGGLRGMTPLRPLEAKISSGFGWRKDPIHGRKRFHNGIDLAAEEGPSSGRPFRAGSCRATIKASTGIWCCWITARG